MALGSHWGCIGVALVWLWWRFRVALVWLWGGLEVALVWLWGGFVLRSLCLVYAYNMALGWLWVACSPSLFKVRGSKFGVRRSASGRNLKHRKAAFRPSAVSLAYITRPGGGWSGPKLSPGSLP